MSRVAASIVAYRSRDRLPACLAALREVRELEDIVVIDHGDDGSADVAEDLGARVLRDPSNPGFGRGHNSGVRATRSEYVLVVNPDARLIASGIASGVALLDDQQDIAIVQGIVRTDTTGEPERSQGDALGPVHLYGRAIGARRLLRLRPVRAAARRLPALRDHVEREPAKPVDVESIAAVAPLVRRSAFDAVGGFDQGYFLYGEDIDLCLRLRRAGWRVVALPDDWAVHASGASSAGWWEREIVWWEGTMRYAALWWDAAAFASGLFAAVLRVLPMALLRPRRASELVSRLLVAPVRSRRRSAR